MTLKINCDTQGDWNGLETLSNIRGTFPLSNDAILKSLRALERSGTRALGVTVVSDFRPLYEVSRCVKLGVMTVPG